jgi:hypothetical protein
VFNLSLGCVFLNLWSCVGQSVCGVTDCFVLTLSLCKKNQCFSKVIDTIAGELTSVHQLHYIAKSMWTSAHRDCQMVKRDSSLQRKCFHCSRVQWRWALYHSSRRFTLHMLILGLCAAARPWKPISRSSRWTVIVLTLLPEAVWNSVVSVATSASVSPVLWACVAYYFAAEPLLLLDVSTSQ